MRDFHHEYTKKRDDLESPMIDTNQRPQKKSKSSKNEAIFRQEDCKSKKISFFAIFLFVSSY